MRFFLSCWAICLTGLFALGAELRFDFGDFKENQTPAGFRSAVTGQGKRGDSKGILDEVRRRLGPLTTTPPPATVGGVVTERPVLAQLSQGPTDEHCPRLVYTSENCGDCTLTTRVQIVD